MPIFPILCLCEIPICHCSMWTLNWILLEPIWVRYHFRNNINESLGFVFTIFPQVQPAQNNQNPYNALLVVFEEENKLARNLLGYLCPVCIQQVFFPWCFPDLLPRCLDVWLDLDCSPVGEDLFVTAASFCHLHFTLEFDWTVVKRVRKLFTPLHIIPLNSQLYPLSAGCVWPILHRMSYVTPCPRGVPTMPFQWQLGNFAMRLCWK